MEERIKNANWRQIKRYLIFWLVIFFAAALFGAVYLKIMLPFLVALFLTYILAPTVDRLERLTVPRTLAVSLIVFFAVALVLFGLTKLVPVLIQQVNSLIHLVPATSDKFYTDWLPGISSWLVEIGLAESDEEVIRNIRGISFVDEIKDHMQTGFKGAWATASTLLGGAINAILVPVITLFLLVNKNKIIAYAQELIPTDLRSPVKKTLEKVNKTLRSVIKGQVTVALILAVLYMAGFSVIGLKAGIAIGFVAGICRIIPYLDIIVAAVLSCIVFLAGFTGWGPVIGVGVVILIIQALDGMFITPRVIGERVGLHPVFVIVSIIAFGTWFGFWGIVLAIPVVAVTKVLWQEALPYYQASKAFTPAKKPYRRRPHQKGQKNNQRQDNQDKPKTGQRRGRGHPKDNRKKKDQEK